MLKKMILIAILSTGLCGCFCDNCTDCDDCSFESTRVIIRTSNTTQQTDSYGFNQEKYVWENWQFSTNRVNNINR